MIKRVRDLPYWTPHAGGAIRGNRASISPEHVTIGIITKIKKDQVEFSVNFNRGFARYTQRTKSEHDARGFAQILKDNAGKTLSSIGGIEIPGDLSVELADCRRRSRLPFPAPPGRSSTLAA